MTHCVLVSACEVDCDGATDGLAVQDLLVTSSVTPGGSSLHLARLQRKTDGTHDRCLGQEGIRQDVIKSALSVYANACSTGAQNAFMRVKQGQSKTANGPFSDGLPSDKPYLYMNVAGVYSCEN